MKSASIQAGKENVLTRLMTSHQIFTVASNVICVHILGVILKVCRDAFDISRIAIGGRLLLNGKARQKASRTRRLQTKIMNRKSPWRQLSKPATTYRRW